MTAKSSSGLHTGATKTPPPHPHMHARNVFLKNKVEAGRGGSQTLSFHVGGCIILLSDIPNTMFKYYYKSKNDGLGM